MNRLLALCIAATFLLFGNGCQNNKKETKSENVILKPLTNKEELKPGKEPKEDLVVIDIPVDTIIGKWIRPDGNYILEIKSIAKDGTLEATYLNPRPIHIAKAEAKKEGKVLVFIKFQDTGYEGSLYELYYDETQDLLLGSYFQATRNQTYQIAFMRYIK